MMVHVEEGKSSSSGLVVVDDNMEKNKKRKRETKLGTLERSELVCLFRSVLSSRNWELAESFIQLANPQAMDDEFCNTLQSSIWFLSTREELDAIMRLIEKIVANIGAYDFTRAAKKASFLASYILAFQSQTMTARADTLTVAGLAQRLKEFLLEGHGCEVWRKEDNHKFIHKCVECVMDTQYRVKNSSDVEIQIRLSAFKTLLEIVGNQIADFRHIFYAACLPLMFFSTSFDLDPGTWATTAIPSLLGTLVEMGADNIGIHHRLCEAAYLGSTELVCILLQIAEMNNLDVDVNQALIFACMHPRIGTMEYLVEEGNVKAVKYPMMEAASRGCKQALEWFIKKGCRDMEICFALMVATFRSQFDLAAWLLPLIPRHILVESGTEIIKAAGKGSLNGLDGAVFLLRYDFLGDPAATYEIANSLAWSDDDDDNEGVAPELRAHLQEHWSHNAFLDGIRQGEQHYMNMMRILKWGESPICLDLLPPDLRVAIAYLPLYRECVNASGTLVSQRLRGQLVDAVRRLGGGVLDWVNQCRELLAFLEHRLPQFHHH